MWGWITAIVIAIAVAYIYSHRRQRVLSPESAFIVSFDSSGIAVADPSGVSRRVTWDQLTRVGIRTTDEGPFVADVFWGFHEGTEEPSVVFPGGATGEQELLAELQRRLEGFHNERLIEATSSASNAYFLLWTDAR